jgi:hypothetical protein
MSDCWNADVARLAGSLASRVQVLNQLSHLDAAGKPAG